MFVLRRNYDTQVMPGHGMFRQQSECAPVRGFGLRESSRLKVGGRAGDKPGKLALVFVHSFIRAFAGDVY
jgi:hypothetical protein